MSLRRWALVGTLGLGVACGGSRELEEEAAAGASEVSALASSENPQLLFDLPFYFYAHRDSFSEAAGLDRVRAPLVPIQQVPDEPDLAASGLALRLVAARDGETTTERAAARREAFRRLAEADLLRTGDVVIAQQPSSADSKPFFHLMLGLRHTILAVVDQDATGAVKATATDFAFDETNGYGISEFDTESFAGTKTVMGVQAFHVLRPRSFSPEQQENLKDWVEAIRENEKLRKSGAILGNWAYSLLPWRASEVRAELSRREYVTAAGKLVLGDETARPLHAVCAEYVATMLALSRCSRDAIRSAPAQGGAPCVEDVLPPAPFSSLDGTGPGYGEGPLMLLNRPGLSAARRHELVGRVFHEGKGESLGPVYGLAINILPFLARAVGAMREVYDARVDGDDTRAQAAAQRATKEGGPAPVFHPQTFLQNALLPKTSPARTFDYVATLVFTDARGIAKAEALAGTRRTAQ